MHDQAARRGAQTDAAPLECPAPVSLRREVRFAAPIALSVMAAMIPATIVIPVLRPLIAAGWPGADWIFYAFMAVNLLGACVVGPLLAVRADQLGQRRRYAVALALVDGAMVALVALMPPLPVMLALRFVQGAASVGAVSLLMGAARGRAQSSAAMGMIGSAVVLALVVGIPLGAILGRGNPALPLFVGGAFGVLAAFGAWRSLPDGASSRLAAREVWQLPGVRRPIIAVGLERFSVGLFTVTLQLHAFHVLGTPDGTTSRWFSVFLVAFALATVPFTRLGDRVGRWRLVAGGALAYGAMFFALPALSPGAMPLALLLGGVGSAAIYGPSLTLVSGGVPTEARASAMSLMNASGTFGMFLGNVLAGGLATVVLAGGGSRALAYGLVFGVAGVSQLMTMVLAFTARGAESTD
ncbi:MAG: MFS transporter [Myxococcaceae bacterium]|nr:MFS transporter [Myxococcaceae bacterium]